MEVTKETKIILLPTSDIEGSTDFSVIHLPNPRTLEQTSYLISQTNIYEIKEIDGFNPHLESEKLKAKTDEDKAVKSFCFERSDGDGFIISDPSTLVTTRFNLVYILISFFVKNQDRFKRFQTLEDLMDSITEFPNFENFIKLPDKIIEKSIELLCDQIKEGDLTFYKFDYIKAIIFIKSKISKISKSFPKTILETLVKPSLFPMDINKQIPEEVLSLSIQKHSILLISTYLLPVLQQEIFSQYDFTKLENYLADLKIDKQNVIAAENSIKELAQQSASSNSKKSKKVLTVTKSQKKPTKKVAVGKGALDGFFKSAAK